MQLSDDIVYLKGVGPARAKVLAAELGVRTVGQLLDHLPFRYIDRSALATVASLRDDGQYVVLRGQVTNLQTTATGKFRERLTCDFYDGTGTMQLVWFAGTKWVREKLKPNITYLVMGRPTLFNGQWQLSHPELEAATSQDTTHTSPFLPDHREDEVRRLGHPGAGTHHREPGSPAATHGGDAPRPYPRAFPPNAAPRGIHQHPLPHFAAGA